MLKKEKKSKKVVGFVLYVFRFLQYPRFSNYNLTPLVRFFNNKTI